MAAYGTTTVEAKSGYGLTVESELKSLEAISDAASRWPGTVVATLLGAHVVPKEFQGCSQKYVETVCKEMIPRAAKRKLAQFVDVFCDKGAFTADETKQIFAAAEKHGSRRSGAYGPAFRDAVGIISQLRSGFVRSYGSCERLTIFRSWRSMTRWRRWSRERIIFWDLQAVSERPPSDRFRSTGGPGD